MKNTTEQQWRKAFDEYKALPYIEQRALRQYAVGALISDGAEEIGSSDVNHMLFSFWKSHECSWDKALSQLT